MKSSVQRALCGLGVAALACHGVAAMASTVYVDGVSAALTSAFDLGTNLPSYIGPTNSDCYVACGNGTNLDGSRVWFSDTGGSPTGGPFNLLVWNFSTARDSVRLYTHQDHYFGGPINDSLAPEVLEYSVWGCNGTLGACKNQSEWTLLSDPIGWTFPTAGKPEYTFNGPSPAATIYRGGSAEFGLVNAYVQDFTFSTSYNFFGVRASTIAFNANTADPELDAMASFNRVDVPNDPGQVPEPGSLALVGAALACMRLVRRR